MNLSALSKNWNLWIRMKRTLAALIVLATNLAAPLLHAAENSARLQTCEFVSTLIEDGSLAGIDRFVQMFSWNPPVVETARNSLAVIDSFVFIAGNIYLVADFDGLAEQHLVVLSSINNGTMFMVIDFERNLGQLVPVYFHFNDSYRDLISAVGASSFEPKKVAC